MYLFLGIKKLNIIYLQHRYTDIPTYKNILLTFFCIIFHTINGPKGNKNRRLVRVYNMNE